MELIVLIAIGLTIWRVSKYFAALNEAQRQSLHVDSSAPAAAASKDLVDAFKELVTQKRRAWIKYQDAEGRITQRNIDIYNCDSTYLFAWCWLRQEPRTFKIENVVQWRALNERFQPDPTVDRYIREQLLPKKWEEKVAWEEWRRATRTQAPSVVWAGIAKDEQSYWIPPGKSIEVCGYRIFVGGLYVGTGLRGLNELKRVEPALIDPKLPIDKPNIDRAGKNVPYWPSYSELQPASRAGYLEWLSSGLEDGQVHVGYAFLFLYGLERRLLGDGKPFIHEKAELEFMQRQLISLLKLYGKIDSFERYAASLLEIVEVCRDKENLYKTSPPIERIGESLPARTQVVISQFASSGQPLPSEWALSLVMCHPDILSWPGFDGHLKRGHDSSHGGVTWANDDDSPLSLNARPCSC